VDDWNDLPTPDSQKTDGQGKKQTEFDIDAFLNSLDNPSAPTLTHPQQSERRVGRARQRLEKRKGGTSGSEHAETPDHITAPARPPDIEPFELSATESIEPRERTRLRDRPSMIGESVANNRPLTIAKRPSQVAVQRETSAFTLPKIDVAGLGSWLYVLIAITIFIGVVVALGLFKNDEVVSYANGVWLGSEWSYTVRPSEEVTALVTRFKQHRIGMTYAYVGYLKGDNVWSGRRAGTNTFDEVQDDVAAFVGQYRIAYPESTLMGWLGVPNDLEVTAGQPYRITDPAVRAEIAAMSARVVNDLGFDGVILNVEPMPERDSAAFIALLQAVRQAIGEEGRLSVTMFADIAPSDLTVPRNRRAADTNAIAEYSRDFKQRVALLTDEIMVMAYNSSLTSPSEYVEWVAYQTQSYAEAVAELEGGAEILIGIPTYDDQGEIHLATVENIPSAVEGVLRGKQRAGTAALAITGVALYAEWTTTDDEWRLFNQFWQDGR
jgi:hypothetical protein